MTRRCHAALAPLWFVLLGLPFLAAPAHSQDDAALNQVLRQMSLVGKTFRSFIAHFSQKKYTAVLKEFDTPQEGELYYQRAKDGRALLCQEVTKPGQSVLTIKGGVALFYQPRLKQAQMYSLGKNKDKAEYLVLGLGQSPARLRETFDIKYLGTDTVGGMPCSVLVLSPKNPSAAAYFSSITLWIAKSTGVPVQQKLQEPGGDYLLVAFSNEKMNAGIPASKFEQNMPSGVEVQRIQ